MFDENVTWGLTVNDGPFSCKTLLPVDSVNNFADFCTGRPLGIRAAVPVIPRVPHSMKEKME
jgi:hypothetical protein